LFKALFCFSSSISSEIKRFFDFLKTKIFEEKERIDATLPPRKREQKERKETNKI
jgi:hypothetical protein